MSSSNGGCSPHLLGIDIGSVSVKAVVCDGEGTVLHTACEAGRGRSLEILRRILRALPLPDDGGNTFRIGVTGSGHTLLHGSLPVRRINEVVAAAEGARRACPDTRTVIDLGGQFTKWILLGNGDSGAFPDAGSIRDFATNGLCAAGTGAFMEQQAGRLDLTVEDLGRAALRAERGASIAGRCSVFAKSDMIHLQQKGAPLDDIAYGLCQAMVRTFAATVLAGREIETPVLLLGGGALNPGLARAFREQFRFNGESLRVPDGAIFLAAEGAAALAADGPATGLAEFLSALGEGEGETTCRTLESEGASLPVLPPPAERPDRRQENPPVPADTARGWLGIDVGSVSTNLVVLGEEMEVLQGVYLPTRGRPVDALDEGLSRIRERFGETIRIAGIGTTGSGRHLAARILGADVVHNEITAQMVSAAHYVSDADTIFEIGGQDSKYIHVRNGRLADFEMNKICAAGTGSFLEEQAERLGIDIVGQFSDTALASRTPCDLGTRCTVFMDSELARAQEMGAPVEDLCAGLAYSVSRNYLEKLVAGRPVGERVVFQGGTASNDAVVAAFRQLLGKPVDVHPYNRISGAIGAALLAARAMEERRYETAFLGFDACADAAIRSFECRRCENLCRVNRVSVGGRVVHFGDTCERFSERDRESAGGGRPFPELFAERRTLIDSFLDNASGEDGEPIGLLRATLNLEYLPFWAEFLRRLGFRPVIPGLSTQKMLEIHSGTVPAEVCLPIKAAAAQAHAVLASGEAPRMFLPSILDCPPRPDDRESSACLYNQGLPDMLKPELGRKIVTAQFALQEGVLGMIDPVIALARGLNRPPDDVARALRSARSVQAEFDAARRRIGDAALDTPFRRAVVVLGKPYNTHDPFLNLSLAALLERVGLPAIPWDLLPLDRVRLQERWNAVPWHFNREQIRALELIRRDGRLFPILVSSYGCGPDAFVVKHAEEMLAGMPRLLLEFDEHRGEAGLLTRLEAFSDEIDSYLSSERGKTGSFRITPGTFLRPRGRRFHLPNVSDHIRMYAAVLRSAGYEAEVLPPVDEETIRLGEEQASGRECHPYAILAGELRRLMQRDEIGEEDVFLSPSCRAPCLLRQYGDAFRILAERAGSRLEIWDGAPSDMRRIVGIAGITRLMAAVQALDILIVLETRLRPYVLDSRLLGTITRETVDALFQATVERRRVDPILAEASGRLLELPRDGDPGDLPVIGITGDLYTRINPAGNAGLFRRLEQMGCEVWPSPAMASMVELGAVVESRNELQKINVSDAVGQGITRAISEAIRQRFLRTLPAPVAELAVEPDPERLLELASSHVGDRSNHLVVYGVAKIADFLSRGAAGAINAFGINCMVGTAIDASVPGLRREYGHAPVISLAYGGVEGPAQRLRLETFVHQASRRCRTVV